MTNVLAAADPHFDRQQDDGHSVLTGRKMTVVTGRILPLNTLMEHLNNVRL